MNATDTQVEAVAKAAGCDEFIRGLENGYETVVGGGGAHLSGGERQRIAIARAMLKTRRLSFWMRRPPTLTQKMKLPFKGQSQL